MTLGGCLIGGIPFIFRREQGRVGKTSILLRYIRGEYDDRQVSTLQASYLDKRITVAGVTAQLSIWDTAGQERFHALGPIYYRDADGALLVYDITDEESFRKVTQWVRELRAAVGEDITISIAGNKIDLENHRQVDQVEAERYVARLDCRSKVAICTNPGSCISSVWPFNVQLCGICRCNASADFCQD